jgi:hypothetical protein
MESGGGPPGPLRGGGEPSSSAKMQIDFGKEPHSEPRSEPPILRDAKTFFDGLTSRLLTS